MEKKIVVKVNETEVLHYNYELFSEFYLSGELSAETLLFEVGALGATDTEIILKDYAGLSKLNDLMISYLTRSNQ